LGAAQAGLPSSVAIDVDPILTSAFEFNFPGARRVLADVAALNAEQLNEVAGGYVDGLIGGPPCQAFSDIGQRRIDDPRRSLLKHFFRLVSEAKPTFFVMENVKGLGYINNVGILNESIDMLPSFYRIVGPLVLDAADFGAATRRPRLFVIGYDPSRCNEISAADLEGAKRQPSTVRAAIGDLASAVQIGEVDQFDLWKIKHRGRPSRYAEGLRDSEGTFTGHRRTEHTADVIRRFAAIEQGGFDTVGRHPRLWWNGQCPTLRAGTGNDRGSFQSVRPIHPEENRVITVREAARLQGFPDRFRFHPTVWHSFRMIGNSVSPIIAKAIFSIIAKRIDLGGRLLAAAE
jgi:DNA (cytosine-5)-methyltransferase 1